MIEDLLLQRLCERWRHRMPRGAEVVRARITGTRFDHRFVRIHLPGIRNLATVVLVQDHAIVTAWTCRPRTIRFDLGDPTLLQRLEAELIRDQVLLPEPP